MPRRIIRLEAASHLPSLIEAINQLIAGATPPIAEVEITQIGDVWIAKVYA